MNGFSEHIIYILRERVLLHPEAFGCVPTLKGVTREADLLLKELKSRDLAVTGAMNKEVVRFDYVVLCKEMAQIPEMIIKAMSLLNDDGLLVLDLTFWDRAFHKGYRSIFGSFHGELVRFDSGVYLVIKSGVDNAD